MELVHLKSGNYTFFGITYIKFCPSKLSPYTEFTIILVLLNYSFSKGLFTNLGLCTDSGDHCDI
jgi:hypothetical protein